MNLIPAEAKLTWSERFALVFGIDIRALAIFRIAAGLIILVDLVLRWQTLTIMYTDDGAVTREIVSNYWRSSIYGITFEWPLLSFHHFSGSVEYQVFLFILAGILAIMLLLGAFTRIATIGSFLLLASLQARNPMILSSGDMILKMLLFWSMFLPLGRIWSIDAIRHGRTLANQKHWILSVATAGILIQFCCMYIFTGISKWNEIWFNGDAMQYVMRLDIYVNSWGRQLLEYPEILKFISVSTVIVEVFSPFLILIPFRTHWFRILNILIYWSLHAGIAMTMSIGLFSYISMIGWLIFLPTIVFCGRGWITSFRKQAVSRPTDSGDGKSTSDQPANSGRTKLAFWRTAMLVPGVVMIAFIISWNINNVYLQYGQRILPLWIEAPGRLAMLDQHFQMFDRPPHESPWFVYEAYLNDGTSVDLFSEDEVVHSKPESVRLRMKYHHLRKLHRNLVTVSNNPKYVEPVQQPFRQSLAEYYIDRWNSSHDEQQQVKHFKLYCYRQMIGPDFNGIDERRRVWYELKTEGSAFDLEWEKMKKSGEFF